MQSVAIFLGGALDIFIAYVMFFVLEKQNEVTDFVMDTSTRQQYQIMEVINTDRFSLSSDQTNAESSSDDENDYGNRNAPISLLMLQNFINIVDVDDDYEYPSH